MGTCGSATKAKDTLNNMSIFNDGSKMNIYLSNLKELVLPKNLMNGRGIKYNLTVIFNLLKIARLLKKPRSKFAHIHSRC